MQTPPPAAYCAVMTDVLRLHFAPDNASLCVRLALEALDLPYETQLVDRRADAHKASAYLALNPNGLIPVLETPQGPLFETGAILLWLEEQRPGTLMPAPNEPGRGPSLSWLIWLANTLHPALRMLFYPAQYCRQAQTDLSDQSRERVIELMHMLDSRAPEFLSAKTPTLHGCYLAPMLRWAVLYGRRDGWFELGNWPHVQGFAQRFEQLEFAKKVSGIEGLGDTPYSAPSPTQPREGHVY